MKLGAAEAPPAKKTSQVPEVDGVPRCYGRAKSQLNATRSMQIWPRPARWDLALKCVQPQVLCSMGAIRNSGRGVPPYSSGVGPRCAPRLREIMPFREH